MFCSHTQNLPRKRSPNVIYCLKLSSQLPLLIYDTDRPFTTQQLLIIYITALSASGNCEEWDFLKNNNHIRNRRVIIRAFIADNTLRTQEGQSLLHLPSLDDRNDLSEKLEDCPVCWQLVVRCIPLTTAECCVFGHKLRIPLSFALPPCSPPCWCFHTNLKLWRTLMMIGGEAKMKEDSTNEMALDISLPFLTSVLASAEENHIRAANNFPAPSPAIFNRYITNR